MEEQEFEVYMQVLTDYGAKNIPLMEHNSKTAELRWSFPLDPTERAIQAVQRFREFRDSKDSQDFISDLYR